jgi:hypothetical protein
VVAVVLVLVLIAVAWVAFLTPEVLDPVRAELGTLPPTSAPLEHHDAGPSTGGADAGSPAAVARAGGAAVERADAGALAAEPARPAKRKRKR